jgi:hypothetical protein
VVVSNSIDFAKYCDFLNIIGIASTSAEKKQKKLAFEHIMHRAYQDRKTKVPTLVL